MSCKIPFSYNKFKKAEKGSVLIEFALIFPLFLLVFLGGTEVFHYLMLERKMLQTVSSVSHFITQTKTVTKNNIKDIFKSVENIMNPFQMNAKSQIIISYIVGTGANPTISKQCFFTTNATIKSKVGTQGSTAKISIINGSFTLNDGEATIITEIYYEFKPYFANFNKNFMNGVFSKQTIYNNSVREPRFGLIDFPDANCPAKTSF